MTMVRLPRNKMQKALQLLKYYSYQNFTKNKTCKKYYSAQFFISYVTFFRKLILSEIFRIFLFWAPNKPPFLRKILKNHIAYTLSHNKSMLHTEFHGNRLSRSPVMPAQTDTHTDRQTDKNVIFVFSALNYTCWCDLFYKNRKLQEIFDLQIYIYIKIKISWYLLSILLMCGVSLHALYFSSAPIDKNCKPNIE